MPIGALNELLVAVIIAPVHTGSEEVPSQSRNTYIQIVSGTPFMATINRRNNYSDQERFSQSCNMGNVDNVLRQT